MPIPGNICLAVEPFLWAFPNECLFPFLSFELVSSARLVRFHPLRSFFPLFQMDDFLCFSKSWAVILGLVENSSSAPFFAAGSFPAPHLSTRDPSCSDTRLRSRNFISPVFLSDKNKKETGNRNNPRRKILPASSGLDFFSDSSCLHSLFLRIDFQTSASDRRWASLSGYRSEPC